MFVTEFTLVQKTSPVNLNAKDSNGRTALHYVAKPQPAGTYDNAEIAFLLAKNGAKMTKDSSGINPYELALMSGATKVAAVLKNHYKLTNKNEVSEKKVHLCFVSLGLISDLQTYTV